MPETSFQNLDLAYDLRQRYAKIVGDHLEDIAYWRKNKKYPNYFTSLEDLYTIVKHKFKEKSKTKEGKIKYEDLVKDLIKIANENSEAWMGKSTDPREIAKIEKALRDIEKFLYFKMDEANMFGSKRDIEGLI